jgi:hypothetical protein
MKSKAKHFGIFTLLAMATTAGTVGAQTYPPIERPNQFSTTQPSLPNRNFPPIVSGSQRQLPPVVSRSQSSLPPIVSSTTNPDLALTGYKAASLRPIAAPTAVPQLPTGTKPDSPIQKFGQRSAAVANQKLNQSSPLKPMPSPQLAQQPSLDQNQAPMVPGLMPQTLNRPQSGQLLSTSGVPFYSSSRKPENVRFTVEEPLLPGTNAHSPAQPEGDLAEIESGIIQQPTVQQPSTSDSSRADQGRSVMAPPDTQSPEASAKLPGETSSQPRTTQRTAPTLDAAGGEANMQMAGESSYFEAAPGASEFTPGCQSCIEAGGVSDCPTCNPSGSYGRDHRRLSRHGYFGAISNARRYGEVDLLYMSRTDGSIVFSNFGGLGSFDFDLGWRATLGRRDDETQGSELSYFGTQDLSKSVNRFDASSRLSALFAPAGVIDAGLTTPFFDANIQNETMQTRLHSAEINRVRWAWDVVKSFVGVRYIYVDDSYNMFSQRGVDTAEYDLQSINNLIGVHIGRELFYDVGYRVSFSGLGKAGVYANVNRFNVDVSNNGTPFLSNRTDSSTFSTSLELLLNAHYQINRRARIRAGYQALLLDEVYSVSDNLTGTLSPFAGSRKPDKDSMFFHGLSAGIEFYR